MATGGVPYPSRENVYTWWMNLEGQAGDGAAKRLIVNADDLGYSVEVNDGIFEAHRRGIVTSTSLLANMPGFEHAVLALREAPGLDVGAHLNIHRGVPLTDAPYLAPGGVFPRSPLRFVIRCLLNPARAREEISREFEAQLTKMLGAGVRVSHLDTEKHLHTLPLVFKVVLSLAKKYHIPSVRLPYELPAVASLRNPGQFVKLLVMALFAPRNRRLLAESGVKSPDRLIGVSLSTQFTVPRLATVFASLPTGITELSCHPGRASRMLENYIDAHREDELRTLTDPTLRAQVAGSGVVLSTFSDIR